MNSIFLRLSGSDFQKGLVVAVLGGIVTMLQNPGAIDWMQVLQWGAKCGGVYLLKNFFSTQDGKFAGIVG